MFIFLVEIRKHYLVSFVRRIVVCSALTRIHVNGSNSVVYYDNRSVKASNNDGGPIFFFFLVGVERRDSITCVRESRMVYIFTALHPSDVFVRRATRMRTFCFVSTLLLYISSSCFVFWGCLCIDSYSTGM